MANEIKKHLTVALLTQDTQVVTDTNKLGIFSISNKWKVGAGEVTLTVVWTVGAQDIFSGCNDYNFL